MLKVWVSNNLVGAIELHSNDRNDYDFSYGLMGRPGNDVSLTMPHSLESYFYQDGLHPVFQMNLPEGRLRETLELTFRKQTKNFNDLNLLEIVGSSQIGRLRFSNDSAISNEIPFQSVNELIAYHGTEDLLRDLIERFAGFSGISGVQPKVLIKDEDDVRKPSDSTERVTIKGATHIVKSWDANEYPHLAANEFYCMKAARYAGLEVPDILLSENNQFLIVPRFDLKEDGSYVGFEDFCSLNGFGTKDKYNSTYERLAKRIKEFVSPGATDAALSTFFRSIVVSCALRNGDAHLKNFGVLYDSTDGRVKLSPTFDVVTTTPYIKMDSMALTLDGSKRFPNEKKLLSFAKLHCNLQPANAKAIMEEVADAVVKSRDELQLHINSFPDFKIVGQRMVEAWDDGIKLTCGHVIQSVVAVELLPLDSRDLAKELLV
jgi:serine/threonine-protein kinase HipA